MEQQEPGTDPVPERPEDTPEQQASEPSQAPEQDTSASTSPPQPEDESEGGEGPEPAREPAPTAPTPATTPDSGPAAPTLPEDEVIEADRHHQHPQRRELGRVHLNPTLTLLLGLAAGIVAIAGLRSVASIIAPTFLAITLIIAVYPVYKLTRRVFRGLIAALLLIVMLYGIIGFLGASLVVAATNFANELADPRYSDTFTQLLTEGRAMLNRWGVDEDQLNQAISNVDLQSLTGLARSVADTLTGLTTMTIFLLTVMIFLVMDAGGISDRIDAIHRQKPDVADSLVDFGLRVRKYWIVATIFGVVVAVIDYFALMWLGVPLAMTFGFLAFVTNYIPNIGFVLGLVPPAFIALLSGGLTTMIWVIAVYCVVNFVIQGILQPKFTGDVVGINGTTAFLSLVFWAYVFGALGALLAIPFTLLVKTLLIDRDPGTQWVNQFIASSPRKRRGAGAV